MNTYVLYQYTTYVFLQNCNNVFYFTPYINIKNVKYNMRCGYLQF